MGLENSKFGNRLMRGRIVFRRSRRCPKHVRGSDLANQIVNTGAQSQVSGLARKACSTYPLITQQVGRTEIGANSARWTWNFSLF